jgi:hypothetical protein
VLAEYEEIKMFCEQAPELENLKINGSNVYEFGFLSTMKNLKFLQINTGKVPDCNFLLSVQSTEVWTISLKFVSQDKNKTAIDYLLSGKAKDFDSESFSKNWKILSKR